MVIYHCSIAIYVSNYNIFSLSELWFKICRKHRYIIPLFFHCTPINFLPSPRFVNGTTILRREQNFLPGKKYLSQKFPAHFLTSRRTAETGSRQQNPTTHKYIYLTKILRSHTLTLREEQQTNTIMGMEPRKKKFLQDSFFWRTNPNLNVCGGKFPS